MSRFKPNAWYEEQQPDEASADDADTAGIAAAQERLRRWMGPIDRRGDDDPDDIRSAIDDRTRDQVNDDYER